MSKLDNITVGHSPLTNRLFIYRFGKKNPHMALDKREATSEVLNSALRHLLVLLKEGASIEFDIDSSKYRLDIDKIGDAS